MDFKAINPAKHALSFLDEFKAFAFKGSMIDLAVGVVIGGAFGNIISSLVHNIIMPLIGVVVPSNQGYEHWVLVIRGKTVPFGRFLGDIVNFLIVALALYVFVVKFTQWIRVFTHEQAGAGPPLTKDQELLTEIRDLLKEESKPAQET